MRRCRPDRARLHQAEPRAPGDGRQALILPTIGRAERDVQITGEQFVSAENSMGVVRTSRGVLDPASPHLLSEPTIVARLATATLSARSRVDWNALIADYDRIRDHIERVIPGFDGYNRRLREHGELTSPTSRATGASSARRRGRPTSPCTASSR
jgi:hypothetical protein